VVWFGRTSEGMNYESSHLLKLFSFLFLSGPTHLFIEEKGPQRRRGSTRQKLVSGTRQKLVSGTRHETMLLLKP
jgi:hypothetical protein